MDREGRRLEEAKLPNDLEAIRHFLKPYGPDVGVAVESTINWYWLVDGLQEVGYDVRLGHTLGLFMITGAKVKTDRRDAFSLARYLRLDDFPEAYVYPKETRPLRDLLRRRIGLVQQRAECYQSLRVQLIRFNLNTYSLTQLKQLTREDLSGLPIPDELVMYCGMLLDRIHLQSEQIDEMEDYLKAQAIDDPHFRLLLSLPGVGYILGMIIYYEVGDFARFPSPKKYASYCRLVPSLAQSSDRSTRGKGGKQGNRYLKFAYTQAASIAVRHYPSCRKFRDRHARRRKPPANKMIANCILAHKLAVATYHMINREEPFRSDKLF
jgi:transposase